MFHKQNLKNQWLTLFYNIILGFILSSINFSTNNFVSGSVNTEISTLTPIPGHHLYYDNVTVARELKKYVQVTCIVPSHPSHQNKAKHVKETWGKRCNKLYFTSTAKAKDNSLPFVQLSGKEEKTKNPLVKTKEIFKFIYRSLMDKADWFLIANDDSFVVLENLRYMLLPYNTAEPIYFSWHFKNGFKPDGAGYVLSREAVTRFAIQHSKACKLDNSDSAEVVTIAKCLKHIGVKLVDAKDPLGRERFFPYIPVNFLSALTSKSTLMKNLSKETEICSNNAILFHFVTPMKMDILEYLIYGLRPYGIYRADTEAALELEKVKQIINARTATH